MTLHRAIVATGRMTDSRHIELDEPVEDLAGEVELIVRSVETPIGQGSTDIDELLRIENEWRAKHPERLRFREDVDRQIAEERELGRRRGMIYHNCIGIYRLEGAPACRSSVVDAMRAEPGPSCISDLVRLECLVGPIRSGDADRKAAFEAQLRKLRRLALTKAVFDRAAKLRATNRLKTPDALQAACALRQL